MTVIEKNDPYGLEPVKALMDNAVAFGTPTRDSLRKADQANGGALPNLKGKNPCPTALVSMFAVTQWDWTYAARDNVCLNNYRARNQAADHLRHVPSGSPFLRNGSIEG